MFRRLLTVSVFPVLVGGGMVAGYFALAAGIPDAAVLVALPTCVAIALLQLERFHPHLPDWNRPRRDVRTDALHLAVSMLVVPALFRVAAFAGLSAASRFLEAELGIALWPRDAPLVAQLGLALVVGELGYYAAHRWMHESALGWRLHATHHSARRLYWLNAARFHPADNLLAYAAEVVPLLLLGCPERTLALFTLFTSLHGMVKHANVRMRLGPLNWVFAMAELHRWHHSPVVAEANHNYGSNLIIWDLVFRTRFLPRREPPAAIGIADMPDFPDGYVAQLTSPLRWRALPRAAPYPPERDNAAE